MTLAFFSDLSKLLSSVCPIQAGLQQQHLDQPPFSSMSCIRSGSCVKHPCLPLFYNRLLLPSPKLVHRTLLGQSRMHLLLTHLPTELLLGRARLWCACYVDSNGIIFILSLTILGNFFFRCVRALSTPCTSLPTPAIVRTKWVRIRNSLFARFLQILRNRHTCNTHRIKCSHSLHRFALLGRGCSLAFAAVAICGHANLASLGLFINSADISYQRFVVLRVSSAHFEKLWL